MPKRANFPNPADMTLRLWSDHIPLSPFASALGYKIDHLHFKGEPMAKDGYLAGRPATRHYASLANAKGRDVGDIADWLRQTSSKVATYDGLVDLLRTGEIEAVFWIAVFGREAVSTPQLEDALVRAVVGIGTRILLENYTPLGPDCPTKVWLPSAPAPAVEVVPSTVRGAAPTSTCTSG